MGISGTGDVDQHGDAVVSGQALSPGASDCGEHVGTCVRCRTEIRVKQRKKFQGEERRQRKTISIKVPQDEQEDGAGVFDELVEALRERYGQPGVPVYFVLVKAMYEALTNADTGFIDKKASPVEEPQFPNDGDPED